MLDFILFKLKQKLQIEDNHEKSEKIIESAVMLSVGAGILPIPLADLVLVTAIQVDMVRQLATIYNVQVQFTHLESWLNALSASLLPQIKTEAIKTIPGLNRLVGGDSIAVLSGASTYAIGQVFVRHFENKGQVSDFRAELVQDYLQEEFENGKKVAAAAAAEIEKRTKRFSIFQDDSPTASSHVTDDKSPNTQPKSPDTMDNSASNAAKTDATLKKLTELTELLEKGLLTMDEFKLLKSKVLQNV